MTHSEELLSSRMSVPTPPSHQISPTAVPKSAWRKAKANLDANLSVTDTETRFTTFLRRCGNDEGWTQPADLPISDFFIYLLFSEANPKADGILSNPLKPNLGRWPKEFPALSRWRAGWADVI